MSRFINTIILLMVILSCPSLFSQGISVFEHIEDNASVGLTADPFERWGMAVSDIDRNGYPDIFVNRWSSPGFSRIYINEGGTFQDITSQSPIEQIEIDTEETSTRTTVWVDYDNDGDRDLAMSTNKQIHLLRNDNNVFTDVSEETGFVGIIPPGFITEWDLTIGGWADYDLDGDLDCVISQVNNDNLYLFRNDDGHFTNVATEAGLDNAPSVDESRHNWMDIDLDGDPDLFSQYHFYRNDNGVFTEITDELGFSELEDCNYRRFFDYDNDGDLDFFKSVSSATAASTSQVFENQDGVFVDVSESLGLTITRDRYRNMAIGDIDNDGDQDVFLHINITNTPDVVLLNDEYEPGVRGFIDVAEFIGVTVMGDRKGCAFLDYDKDGFLDIYVPSAEFYHILYHNTASNGANWVSFILEGNYLKSRCSR